MGQGKVTFTNLGSFDVSGAALLTAASAVTDIYAVSGSRLFVVPTAGGNQVQLFKMIVGDST